MAHPEGGDGVPHPSGIVDLGDRDGTDPAPAAGKVRRSTAPHRRRAVYLATGVAALLILAANLVPRPDAPLPPAKAVQRQDRPLSVCEAVAFANQTGGLPSKPTVLPSRASGYFTFLNAGTRVAVATGLMYSDGSISLCRPVREPGTGSPQPRQRELPLLARGETYAYEMRPEGLTLIGERAPDGTVTRYGD